MKRRGSFGKQGPSAAIPSLLSDRVIGNRSAVSGDSQGNRWWLASDGKWYPPELHPSVRASAPDDQDRNAALLNATIGVALVREKVFADVLGETGTGELSFGEAETRPASAGDPGHRRSDQEGQPRRDLPRFRARETPSWPVDTRESARSVPPPRLETRWRPEGPERASVRRPPPRSSGSDRPVPEAPGASAAAPARPETPPAASLPPLRGWTAEPTRWTPQAGSERFSAPESATSLAPGRPETSPLGQVAPVELEAAIVTEQDMALVAKAALLVVEEDLPVEDAALPVVEDAPAEEAVALGDAPAQALATPVEAELPAILLEDAEPAAAVSPLVEPEPLAEDLTAVGEATVPLFVEAAEDQPAVGVTTEPLVVEAEPVAEDLTAVGEPAAPLFGEAEPVAEDLSALGEAGAPPLVEETGFFPPSLAEGRVLPPMARRRPSRVRSTSDLREAVADAVARAAAQGPLLPRGPEDELEEDDEATVLPVPEGLAPSPEETAPSPATTPPQQPVPGTSELPGPGDEEHAKAAVEVSSPAEPENEAISDHEPEAHQVGAPVDDDSSWPFGERRSAARQARKPLPAALQEAVAAGTANDLETASKAGPGAPKASEKTRGKGGGGGGMVSSAGPELSAARRPGILRRYGSAIAIIILFLAAAGAAAGIAAFRGPVNPSTAAQDQAAADQAVLSADLFPNAWHVTSGAGAAGAYGLASALLTPSSVRAWLRGHGACSSRLEAVSAAMTPSAGDVTAVAYSQASTTNPLGGPWQIADAVAFHTSAEAVRTDIDTMRSVLAQAQTQRCVAQFLTAALQSQLPTGPKVTLTVAPRTFPPLPGSPFGWALEVIGSVSVGQSSLPLRCQITALASGRAEVLFVVSSKGAALPGNLATRLLSTLAARTERQASSSA